MLGKKSSSTISLTSRWFSTTVFCFLATLILGTAAARAESSQIPFETVKELAMRNSPRIAEIRAASVSVQAEGLETKALPSPSLDGKGEWPIGSEKNGRDTEYEISLSQPLRVGDLSGQRHQTAQAFERISKAQDSLETREFLAELLVRFAAVAAREEIYSHVIRVHREIEGALSRAQTINTGAVLAGSVKELLGVERAIISGAENEISSALASSRAELIKFIGAPLPNGRFLAPQLKAPQGIEDFLRSFKENNANEIVRVRLQAALAIERDALARQDRLGDITPRAIYRRSDDGADFFGFGLQIPLPVWGAGRGERSLRRASAESATSSRSFLESTAFEEYIKEQYSAYTSSRQHVLALRDKTLPTLERAISLAANEVQGGQSELQRLADLGEKFRALSADGLAAYLNTLRLQQELMILSGKESL